MWCNFGQNTSCEGTITRIAKAYNIDLSNLEPMPGIKIIGAEAMTMMGILGRTIQGYHDRWAAFDDIIPLPNITRTRIDIRAN